MEAAHNAVIAAAVATLATRAAVNKRMMGNLLNRTAQIF